MSMGNYQSSVPKPASIQAYTMGIAELRRSVEQPGGETVRTVPLLERNDRQRQQANRLSGVETEVKAFNNHKAFSRTSSTGKTLNTIWF